MKANDSAAGSVDLTGPAYTPGALAAVGSLSGTIKLDGVSPADSAITSDDKICGTTAQSEVNTNPKGLADVMIWVADAKTGKAMPVEKRIALSSQKCTIDPRMQGTIVGSTVNVFNDDRALHTLVFLDAASGDTLQKMPFFNEGQVVASEKLAKRPGIVEVRCVQHPWTRGYIAVFDDPYFAVTEEGGAFKIDSLPPGTYTVHVWHEGMKQPLTQRVTISAGGNAKLDLAIKLQ